LSVLWPLMLRRRDDAISCFAGEVWGCSYPRRAGLLLRHAGRVGVGHSSSLMSFISAQEFQAQEPACSPAFRFICGLLIIHILPPACRYANGRALRHSLSSSRWQDQRFLSKHQLSYTARHLHIGFMHSCQLGCLPALVAIATRSILRVCLSYNF